MSETSPGRRPRYVFIGDFAEEGLGDLTPEEPPLSGAQREDRFRQFTAVFRRARRGLNTIWDRSSSHNPDCNRSTGPWSPLVGQHA
jgi:hypothetical protein